MTTSLDRTMRPLADSLLRANGKSMVLRRELERTHDSTTLVRDNPWHDYPCYGCFMYRNRTGHGAPSNEVRFDQQTIFISDLVVTGGPRPGDKVIIGDTAWEVVSADPIYSGDLPALWNLRVKR